MADSNPTPMNAGIKNADASSTSAAPTANPLFALGQMLRAQAAPISEEKKTERTEKWLGCLTGMLDGTIDVGTHAPIAEYPVWVSLEVLPGGFASGNIMSSFLEGDQKNDYWFTEKGALELLPCLETSCYQVKCPEQSIIPCIIWLMKNDRQKEAEQLYQKVLPMMSKVKMYPVLTATPAAQPNTCSVATVGDIKEQFEDDKKSRFDFSLPRPRKYAAQAASRALTALKLKIAEFFESGCECQCPQMLLKDAAGHLVKNDAGRFQFVPHPECHAYDPKNGCGWLNRDLSYEWNIEAKKLCRQSEALLTFQYTIPVPESRRCQFIEETKQYGYVTTPAYDRVVNRIINTATGCIINGRKTAGGSTLGKLYSALRTCAISGNYGLTCRQVCDLRFACAAINTKYGVVGSASRAAWMVVPPAAQDNTPALLNAVISRLSMLPQELGVEDISPIVAPVQIGDALVDLPQNMVDRVNRARSGTLNQLLEWGSVSSLDMLPPLIKNMMEKVVCCGVKDPILSELLRQTYTSFKKVRSLLLTNMHGQKRMSDLPHNFLFTTIHSQQGDEEKDVMAREAKAMLSEIMMMALKHFPHALIPNKLLQSLRDLVKQAKLDICLVDELAVDIFGHSFSQKFVVAAKHAARMLADTLYAQHFGLTAAFAKLMREGGVSQDEFYSLCEDLSEPGAKRIARNGSIIESMLLMTGANLPALLNVATPSYEQLETAIMQVWKWMLGKVHFMQTQLAREELDYNERTALLTVRKDVAYAWRNLVVYLSRCPVAEHSRLFTKMTACSMQMVTKEDGSGVKVTTLEPTPGYEKCFTAFLLPLIQGKPGPRGWISGAPSF